MRLRHALALIAVAPAVLAQTEWKARVVSIDGAGRGFYGSDEHSSRVRIERDAIQIRGKKTAPFDIPLSSITRVEYDGRAGTWRSSYWKASARRRRRMAVPTIASSP